MSSIRDVAMLAGVSPATVSRVMNGTAKVDPEKAQRVLSAIRETGFVPNQAARSLVKKNARLLGLIIPNLHNPFFTQLAADIEAAAEARDFHVFTCTVGHDTTKVREAMQVLMSMNVSGVILTVSNPEILQLVSDYTIPVAAVDCMENVEHASFSVHCDYYSGGRMAMEHLLSCGCKKVICIQGDQSLFSARMRYEGYRDVCREKGIPEYTLFCDYDFHAGLQMTKALLNLYPDADGILACNDLTALSIFKILTKKQIRVPQQIQLMGFDDIHLAELMTPELSTIHQPTREMAEYAVDCLAAERSPAETGDMAKVLPVSLKIRETTTPL